MTILTLESLDAIDVDLLAIQMRQTRDAFGYTYRRAAYARTQRLRELWEADAPWMVGSMVPYAQNMRDAILRDIAFRMPVHDMPGAL